LFSIHFCSKFVIYKLKGKAFIVHHPENFQKNHANLWTFFELAAIFGKKTFSARILMFGNKKVVFSLI